MVSVELSKDDITDESLIKDFENNNIYNIENLSIQIT